jgi:hypothetical protein
VGEGGVRAVARSWMFLDKYQVRYHQVKVRFNLASSPPAFTLFPQHKTQATEGRIDCVYSVL